MSEEKRLLLSKFTSGYFVSSAKENEKWNNIEQQYRISEEIYEDIEQLQQENKKYKEVIDKIRKIIYEIDELRNTTGGYPSNYIDDLLSILKEVEHE